MGLDIIKQPTPQPSITVMMGPRKPRIYISVTSSSQLSILQVPPTLQHIFSLTLSAQPTK